MRKKSFALVLLLTLVFVLAGCSPVHFEDVYQNHPSLTKYDGYEPLGKLPVGYTVAYNDNNFTDPFFDTHSWVVIKNNSRYAVYDYKNSSFVLGGGSGATENITYFKKNEKFLIGQQTNGSKVNITVAETKQSFEANTTNLSDVIIPSGSSDVLFVRKDDSYEIYNKNGYLHQIAKQITYQGSSYRIDTIIAYDNVIMAKSGSNCAIFYEIPTEVADKTSMLLPSEGAIFTASSGIFPSYIGEDKFYIYEQNSSYNDDFDFKITNNNSANKYKAKAYIYNAKDNKVEKEIVDNKYYKNIIFSHRDNFVNKMGDLKVTINDVFKEGYKFVDQGFYIDKATKEANTDQFVLDSKNEVVVSLSGKIAGDLNINKDRLSNFSPLMLMFVDGKGVSPNSNWNDIRLMNIDGTTAFEKKGEFKDLYYNNDALVCNKANVNNTVGAINNNRFGAFDKNGNQIVEFKYDYMTPFISEYALAYDTYIKYQDELIRYNEVYLKEGEYYKPDGTKFDNKFNPNNADKIYKIYRVDKNGNEMLIEDMAETPVKNILIFKVGAYVSKNDDGTFNVKNIEGEKLFNENFKTVVINKPNFDDVTICATSKADNQVYIYRLTSSTRDLPESKSILDIVIPVSVVGGLLVVAVIVVVVIKAKGINKKVANKQNESNTKVENESNTKVEKDSNNKKKNKNK